MILKITECIYLYNIILRYYYAKFKYTYLIYNGIIKSVSSKVNLSNESILI